jgi:hypothetical protein
MLKKYLTKFTVDILPSVAATVIGAYIVNHYIISKPGADAPVASAVSTAVPVAAKADVKTSAKTPETSADSANLREPGVKAKGISEKAVLERAAAEKPQVKSGEHAADKPAETAAIPVETRRHQPAPREKTVAKTVPVPAPAAVPVVSAPAPVPPAETASTPEERRDANDLARAAIERLRGANEGPPRAQEAARAPDAARVPPDAARVPPDAARVPDAPRVVSAPPVRPLPPPILVSTPANETFDSQSGPSPPRPPYAGTARIDDPNRPTPPADIPARPLDLRAEAAGSSMGERTTVAEDVLSAAKSVFHAVLPK